MPESLAIFWYSFDLIEVSFFVEIISLPEGDILDVSVGFVEH